MQNVTFEVFIIQDLLLPYFCLALRSARMRATECVNRQRKKKTTLQTKPHWAVSVAHNSRSGSANRNPYLVKITQLRIPYRWQNKIQHEEEEEEKNSVCV